MRLPGFTAERNILQVVPSYSEGFSAVGETAIKLASFRGLGYLCTPDNQACVCSGLIDCFRCALDTRACGDLSKTCDCSPRTGACGCS